MPFNRIHHLYVELIDSISKDFFTITKDKTDKYSEFAKHTHSFIHERIDAMLVLIQNDCFWDADMILRPIAEAVVKLVYVSNFNEEKNNAKVDEFWNELAEINFLQQSLQVKEILKMPEVERKYAEDLILSEEKEAEYKAKWPKKERQKIQQPWSFNEMIRSIANSSNTKEIICLNRTFTQSSHLLHADETAYGVIWDRKNRNDNDRAFLEMTHIQRLYNDSYSLFNWIYQRSCEIYKVDINENVKSCKKAYIQCMSEIDRIAKEHEMS